ncbi:RadC family protein [Loigolactobacillus zhaoyuanensis]|uniref:DNA repair protein RadC n=1 Tax=Loigolactobacillus zhaoyuanensis TaxID=2486017 RepID=A0ABW8U9X5_9LACO|nr:DNA repair protein RadC [Loigolactobacillus zhaoyuanensis]
MLALETNKQQWQPREQLLYSGAASLTDQQLLAILLRTGTKSLPVMTVAQQVLLAYPQLATLVHAKISDLEQINGIGQTKAIELQAALELGRRSQLSAQLRFGTITSSQQVGEKMIARFAGCRQEHLLVVYLDTKNQIIKEQELFRGTLNASVAHPREIFAYGLQIAAARFILVHNHPSGMTEPSNYDLKFTQRVANCGDLMGIECLDHLIVGRQSYSSLKERGEL